MTSIRTAVNSDLDRIAELTVQLGYEVLPSDLAPRLARILALNDHQFFVAEHDGRVVGWVHVTIVDSVEADPFAMIVGLIVDKNHRGVGTGRSLMTMAEAWAKHKGCSIVRLWSSATRTAAHQFYGHIGYRNLKTQYSFGKAVTPDGDAILGRFVPKVDQ